MEVARYIRWSTEEQTQGTTREVQLELVNAYCQRQGWAIRPDLLFVDEGQSGGSLERPALERLRREIAASRVDCVVVARLDRLARSLLDAGLLVMREWEGRAELRSATEQFDLASPFGRQAFYTQVGYAELERAMIRERTMSGKRQRAVRGQNPGVRPPYGYRLGLRGRPWGVVAAEAAVVRRVFAAYLAGQGLVRIRDGLNREGIPAARGGAWTAGSLYVMLQNPVYAGLLVYGRTGRRSKKAGRGPAVVAEPLAVVATFAPVIVERETYEAVQCLRRAKGGRARAAPGSGQAARALAGQSLLTGVARCRCGAGMVRRSGAGALYYGCAARHDRGPEACEAPLVPQALVDDMVVRLFLARFGPRLTALRAQAGRMGCASTDLVADEAATLRHCQAEQADLQRQLRRVQLDYRRGALGAAQWQEVREALRADLSRLAGREAAARIRREHLARPRGIQSEDPWSPLTQAQRKLILRALLPGLTLWRDQATGTIHMDLMWGDSASTAITS